MVENQVIRTRPAEGRSLPKAQGRAWAALYSVSDAPRALRYKNWHTSYNLAISTIRRATRAA
jgi:hypothetical protein